MRRVRQILFLFFRWLYWSSAASHATAAVIILFGFVFATLFFSLPQMMIIKSTKVDDTTAHIQTSADSQLYKNTKQAPAFCINI